MKKKLPLNPAKCRIISFCGSTPNYTNNYTINRITLERVTSIRDIGVIYDSNLIFSQHVESTVNSASRARGCVLRVTKNYEEPETIRILYDTLVRSELEYATIAWNPLYKKDLLELEEIQKRFLKYLSFHAEGEYPPRGSDY